MKTGLQGKSAPAPPAPSATTHGAALPGNRLLLAAVIIIAAGLAAYASSFGGAFVFDDIHQIVIPGQRGTLWPPWHALAHSNRPLVFITIAANYAACGANPLGYHAFNLAVHLLAGLVLFGLVRRTLALERVRQLWHGDGYWPALLAATVWLVHPLQTQGVTYVIQRYESTMGLFYLLTFYCVVRGAQSSRVWLPYVLAVVACAAGMACKEVMVTAPVLVFAYDRLFLAGSFRGAVRQRWPLYAGLAATWVILLWCLKAPEQWSGSGVGWSGVGVAGAGGEAARVTPLGYALSQPGVILHYLRLALWPHPLCLDYAWPLAHGVVAIGLPLLLVAGLAGGSLLGLWRGHAWSFFGLWFFGVLSLSSSFLPIADLAVEHRMYLPLAGLTTPLALLGVLGWERVGRCVAATHPQRCRLMRAAGWGLSGAVVLALGAATFVRNLDYASERSIWQDTVRKRPLNPRAHLSYGLSLSLAHAATVREAASHFRRALELDPAYAEAHFGLGLVAALDDKMAEVTEHYRAALKLRPNYAEAHNNLGQYLLAKGAIDEAVTHFAKAIEASPTMAEARFNMGAAMAKQEKADAAIRYYGEAIRLNPQYAAACYCLGNLLLSKDDLRGAREYFAQAIRLKPDLAEARYGMGVIEARQKHFAAATRQFQEALKSRPDYPDACLNLGNVAFETGKLQDAVTQYTEAIRLKPDYAEARRCLGTVLLQLDRLDAAAEQFQMALNAEPQNADAHCQLGKILVRLRRLDAAVQHLQAAVRLKPDASAHNELGYAYFTQGQWPAAEPHFSEAIRLKPDFPEAHNNLASTLAQQKRYAEAASHYEQALRLKPDYDEARKNLALARTALGQK